MRNLIAVTITLLFTVNLGFAQGVLPSREIIKAYFDSNFSYLKLSAENDKIRMNYLPTSYVSGESVENYVEFTFSREFIKYKCRMYQIDSDYVVETEKITMTFPQNENAIGKMLNEGMELQLLDGFSLNIQFPSERYYGNESGNIADRLRSIAQKENCSVYGSSMAELAKLSKETFPLGTSFNTTIKNAEIRVHAFYKNSMPLENVRRPVPYQDILFKEYIKITGDELSMRKFLGLTLNSSWGSIRCKIIGNHTALTLKLGGHVLDYLLDTGASYLTIDDEHADEMILSGQAVDLHENLQLEIANGELVDARKILIKRIVVEDVVVENVIAVSTRNNPKLLGMSFLNKFRSWKISEDGGWLRYKR